MRILVENSSWNNIGDAFYQFSLFNLLKKSCAHHRVAFLNAPTTRSFREYEGLDNALRNAGID